MLFLDGKRVNLKDDLYEDTNKTYLQILKEAFPEIEQNANVTVMLSERFAKPVDGQRSDGTAVKKVIYPTNTKKLQTDFYGANGERRTAVWQNTMPKKKDGDYVFTSTLKDCLIIGGERPSVSFNIPQDIEMLAYLYFYDDEFEGGKRCVPHKATIRVVNEIREAQRVIEIDTILDRAKAAIRTANLDKLSQIYQSVFNREIGAGSNEVTLRAGLISSIDKNPEVKERVIAIFRESDEGNMQTESLELVQSLIDAGHIFAPAGVADKVYYLDKKGEEKVLCSASIEDVKGIAEFLNKNTNMKKNLSSKLSEVA